MTKFSSMWRRISSQINLIYFIYVNLPPYQIKKAISCVLRSVAAGLVHVGWTVMSCSVLLCEEDLNWLISCSPQVH